MRTESAATAVERPRDRDRVTLDGLLEEVAPRVFRLAYGITGDEAEAEAIVRHVLVSLLRGDDGPEGPPAAAARVCRLTVEAALGGQWAHAARETPIEERLPAFADDGHRRGEPASLAADWSDGVGSDLVRRATATLPDRYRVVLLLRDLEGLSGEETAEVLGDSPDSVKRLLHRARMVLREELTRQAASRADLTPA